MKNLGVKIGFVFAALVAGVLFIAGFQLGESLKYQWLNVLLIVGGGLMGWIVGVFLTPLGETEAKRFSELGLGITALAGGAVATKIVEALGKKVESGLDFAFVSSACLFSFALLLGGLCTFVWRMYIADKEPADT